MSLRNQYLARAALYERIVAAYEKANDPRAKTAKHQANAYRQAAHTLPVRSTTNRSKHHHG